MKRAARSALLPFLFLLAPAACATTAGEDGAESTTRVMIEVENSARADLDVSILSGGQELRLGRVQLGDTGRFRAPATLLRNPPFSFSVRLVARDGTGTYLTPQLNVREGQNVQLYASPTLSSSRFEVR